KGITLQTLNSSPETMLDVLSTFLDFDVHYSVMETVFLKSQMFPISQIEDLPNMYDHNFGWINLMSSLEQLSDLVTQAKMDQSNVNSMKSAWENVRDIVFDKSLK
ncbi:hypothetical protein Bpfe_014088, partial [Biomphalaria pfeifferi]